MLRIKESGVSRALVGSFYCLVDDLDTAKQKLEGPEMGYGISWIIKKESIILFGTLNKLKSFTKLLETCSD